MSDQLKNYEKKIAAAATKDNKSREARETAAKEQEEALNMERSCTAGRQHRLQDARDARGQDAGLRHGWRRAQSPPQQGQCQQRWWVGAQRS